MAPDSDRLFKKLWLVNAVMLLVAMGGVIALVVHASRGGS